MSAQAAATGDMPQSPIPGGGVPIITVDHLTMRFGGLVAIDDVSFQAATGRITAIIGPNGAGKTTAFKAVTGQIKNHAGSVVLQGQSLDRLSTAARVRAGLALSHQIVRPFRDMTVLANVTLAGGSAKTAGPWSALFHRDRRPEEAKAVGILARLGIADAAQALPGSLPLGYLKRLEMARALALEPTVLLLDEPLAGLNHLEAAALADTIAAINREGTAIVLIEHNLGEVLRVCQRLVVLDAGRVIAEGAPDRVMAEAAVQQAYLGRREASHA